METSTWVSGRNPVSLLVFRFNLVGRWKLFIIIILFLEFIIILCFISIWGVLFIYLSDIILMSLVF